MHLMSLSATMNGRQRITPGGFSSAVMTDEAR
jgi:hypothetical protein